MCKGKNAFFSGKESSVERGVSDDLLREENTLHFSIPSISSKHHQSVSREKVFGGIVRLIGSLLCE